MSTWSSMVSKPVVFIHADKDNLIRADRIDAIEAVAGEMSALWLSNGQTITVDSTPSEVIEKLRKSHELAVISNASSTN